MYVCLYSPRCVGIVPSKKKKKRFVGKCLSSIYSFFWFNFDNSIENAIDGKTYIASLTNRFPEY